jgi:hypothetical protein
MGLGLSWLGAVASALAWMEQDAPTAIPAFAHHLIDRLAPLGDAVGPAFLLLGLFVIGKAYVHWCDPADEGLCAVCGYDLRASAGRCPECGAPIPSVAGNR